LSQIQLSENYQPACEVVTEKAVVNGIVGLMASGGSTNLTIHLIAIARAAGIIIDWNDFDEISSVVPLLARVYPNGKADVNHFQAAGGVQLLITELIAAGMLHVDVKTVAGSNLSAYTRDPYLSDGELLWRDGVGKSIDDSVIKPVSEPFDATGGLKLLHGNLGRGVIKVSAVAEQHRIVEAPAKVFDDQDDVVTSFRNLELEQDVIIVLKSQGPRSNGMPELHKLTPPLGVLQDKGYKVALVTDGRMSGASGKVPAAIHMSPEACAGGPLALVRDGDMIRLDGVAGTIELMVDQQTLQSRTAEATPDKKSQFGMGRELFSRFRRTASSAEQGASSINIDEISEG